MAGLNRITGGRVVYYSSEEHTLKKVRSNLYVGHGGGHALYVFDSGKPFEPDRVVSCVRGGRGMEIRSVRRTVTLRGRQSLPATGETRPLDGPLLREYLKAMGLFPFDPSFFHHPSDPGILVERTNYRHSEGPNSLLPGIENQAGLVRGAGHSSEIVQGRSMSEGSTTRLGEDTDIRAHAFA